LQKPYPKVAQELEQNKVKIAKKYAKTGEKQLMYQKYSFFNTSMIVKWFKNAT